MVSEKKTVLSLLLDKFETLQVPNFLQNFFSKDHFTEHQLLAQIF